MSKKKSTAIDRRDFFRKASLGVGVAGAAASPFAQNQDRRKLTHESGLRLKYAAAYQARQTLGQ